MRGKLQLLKFPWADIFDSFLGQARHSLVLASPYVTMPVARRIASALASSDRTSEVHLHLATNLEPRAYATRAADLEAILLLADTSSDFRLTHVPGLHAKVYVADRQAAIVTSANLTQGGLSGNREYGVLLKDERLVSEVKRDITAYCSLGAAFPVEYLPGYERDIGEVRLAYDRSQRSMLRKARKAFDSALDRAQTRLMERRAHRRTTNSLLAETVLYLLRSGPKSTVELHEQIKVIHPDICDDSIDRVIGDLHFGKKWKHYVRSAQQFLKRKGLVRLGKGLWRLQRPE